MAGGVVGQPDGGVFAGLRDSLPRGQMVPWPSAADDSVPKGSIFDVLQIRPTHVGPGAARAQMRVGSQHLNQRGFCQGGALVTLADATAGWATYCLMPDGHRFTTLQLQCNLIGSARHGDMLVALAAPVHSGRSTVVLSVEIVRDEEEHMSGGQRRLCAFFTCTQSILQAR